MNQMRVGDSTMKTKTTYSVLTESGGELADGLSRDEAFACAQRLADERGEDVVADTAAIQVEFVKPERSRVKGGLPHLFG